MALRRFIIEREIPKVGSFEREQQVLDRRARLDLVVARPDDLSRVVQRAGSGGEHEPRPGGREGGVLVRSSGMESRRADELGSHGSDAS